MQTINVNQPPSWWAYSAKIWHDILTALEQADYSVNIEHAVKKEQWSQLTNGLSNFNYQLNLGHNRFFIQIINHANSDKLPYQQFVAIHQELAKQSSLLDYLPQCLFESENLRIFEWLDQAPITNSFFNDDILMNQLSLFLFHLHNQKPPQLPQLDIRMHLSNYLQAANLNTIEANEFSTLIEQAENAISIFQPSTLCHHDLSPHNILYSKKLYIIDWEYACISDPLFDLAGLCFNFDLNKQQERKLLKSYYKLLPKNFSENKFNAMKKLYQLLDTLWRR